MVVDEPLHLPAYEVLIVVRKPRTQAYGTVAVFKDLIVNLWYLIQSTTNRTTIRGLQNSVRGTPAQVATNAQPYPGMVRCRIGFFARISFRTVLVLSIDTKHPN